MKHFERIDAVTRRKNIIALLEQRQKISVKELAQAFSVSEMTIRRDLHELEDLGIASLHYGGANLRGNGLLIPSVSNRDISAASGKKAIAQKAASFLKDGDMIFLDAGSTVLQMLHFLPNIRLKVVTNSMPVITLLHAQPKIELYVAPGRYDPATEGMADLSTLEYLRKFKTDQAFLGAYSVDLHFGVGCNSEIEAALKAQARQNTAQSFLLADHEKFERSGLYFQNEIKDFSYIITDAADENLLRRMRERSKNILTV